MRTAPVGEGQAAGRQSLQEGLWRPSLEQVSAVRSCGHHTGPQPRLSLQPLVLPEEPSHGETARLLCTWAGPHGTKADVPGHSAVWWDSRTPASEHRGLWCGSSGARPGHRASDGPVTLSCSPAEAASAARVARARPRAQQQQPLFLAVA